MFDQVDQDGDGELDEHEFIKLNINIIVIIDFIIAIINNITTSAITTILSSPPTQGLSERS